MHPILLRADAVERTLCIRINLWSRNRACRRLFQVVSRLGDGVAWYTLMIVVALGGGVAATLAMLHVGLTALVGLWLYKALKARLVRPRPFVSHGEVEAVSAPLDEFSFPSGHTLHAVLFTVMLTAYVPALLWLTLPFAMLVAASRVVLGLHYPSDVLVGAALGATLATISLALAGGERLVF